MKTDRTSPARLRAQRRSRLGRGRGSASAILLIGLWVLGCAKPFESQTWTELQSEHFTVISSADLGTTREIARDLEFFHMAALRVLNLRDFEAALPTRVFAFADESSFARFRPRADVAGLFFKGPEANYLLIDASKPNTTRATTYHEYVHFLMQNAGAISYPAWYHEGLSELLSTLEFDENGGHLNLGLPPPGRVSPLALGAPLSLRRLLTAQDTLRWSPRALQMFYAESWAFVHWMFIGQIREAPQRRDQLISYLAALQGGADPEMAFDASFGTTIDRLEPEFLRYVQARRFPVGKVAAPAVALRSGNPRRLPPPDHLHALAELALTLGPEAAADPERLLRTAIGIAPTHARSHATLARILAERNEAEARVHFDLAAKNGAGDAKVELDLGLTSMQLARRGGQEALALRSAATERMERSLALDPNQIAPVLALANDALQSGENLDRTIDRVERAIERRPDFAPLELLLAELYLARGDSDRARERISQAVRLPHAGDESPIAGSKTLAELVTATGLEALVDDPTAHLEVAVEWVAPERDDHHTSIAPLAPLQGRAGLGDALSHDVVIAIDVSGSTASPAQFDVNADGRIDPDAFGPDSILSAELAAARKLVARFDPVTTRVGLVVFAEVGSRVTPLGAPAATTEAISSIATDARSQTSFAAALAKSFETLVQGIEQGTRRQRSIVMLSDGAPNVGGEAFASQDSLRIADELAGLGIRVHSFAIGTEAVLKSAAYRLLAERTNGQYVPVEDIEQIESLILDLRLSSLDGVQIRNLSSGARGRAVRVFPDGSFDGYVPLEQGWNDLELEVVVTQRAPVRERRRVYYESPAAPTEVQTQAAKTLLEELRLRTIETESIPQTRRQGSRSIEIETRRDERTPSSDGQPVATP